MLRIVSCVPNSLHSGAINMSHMLNPSAPMAYLPPDVARGYTISTYGTIGATAVNIQTLADSVLAYS